MADRMAALGGMLEVHSAPGRGTTVVGRVPAQALLGGTRPAVWESLATEPASVLGK
jgi:signal transduction histidine kinase